MKISRELNVAINWVLQELLPPFVRDSKIFMTPFFRLMFGSRAHLFLDFHENVYKMSDQEFAQINVDIQPVIIDRPTDLNNACVEKIGASIAGSEVLEVGCGRGYLCQLLAKNYKVTGVDIALPAELKTQANFKVEECASENLPFADKSFDTVICAHTLEHVRDIQKTLAELRRVCRKRLIIVVPCERPYFYTFNLHIHFFPYAFSLLAVTGIHAGHSLEKIGGDWVYIEEKA